MFISILKASTEDQLECSWTSKAMAVVRKVAQLAPASVIRLPHPPSLPPSFSFLSPFVSLGFPDFLSDLVARPSDVESDAQEGGCTAAASRPPREPRAPSVSRLTSSSQSLSPEWRRLVFLAAALTP